MAGVDHQVWLEIMYQALASPVGLLLQVSDLQRARVRFYQTRRAALDPELNRLQFRASPFEGGNLVICKGAVAPPVRRTPSGPSLQDLDLD